MAPAHFFLQDSRSFVGNDMLWWAKDGKGYTTDLSKAHRFTLPEAQAQHTMRSTDVPWPTDYIEARARPEVAIQRLNQAEALLGSGIRLSKPEPKIKAQCRCGSCGRLMSENQFWASDCAHCGANNRP